MKQFAAILLVLVSFAVSAGSPAPTAPQSANEFFQLGFNAANNGQYDVAIKNYSTAIDIDPTRIYFYYHRGLAHKALGEKAQATADFNQCLSMKPIAEAYYEIGVFRYEAMDLNGAKDYFEKAKELKDDVDKLNFYLGVINYRMNNYDTAEVQLAHYVHLIKTNSDAFLYLALVKLKMQKYDEVSPMLKLACLYNDNDWKLHLKMYEIYKEIGDKDNMLAHISMVIELGQTKPEYYNIRAQLYLEKGENLRAGYDLLYAKGGKN